MKKIDGITMVIKCGYAFCHINDFSDELQLFLKSQLSFICYGSSSASSKRSMYNYQNTMKEFLKRYNTKSDDTRKGMIGELLTHVLINAFFTEYQIVSPFFNLEERSIKKGFDVVLSSKSDHSIWITEVKSGELRKDKDANATTVELLNTAKNDLYDRLNGESHSLWLNAINGAKISFDNHTDLKDVIVDILEQYGDESADNLINSKQLNVFLVSTLFAPLSDSIKDVRLMNKYKSIIKEDKFKNVFVLSLQKETFQKISNFLESECEY